jgi:hypothetical protein
MPPRKPKANTKASSSSADFPPSPLKADAAIALLSLLSPTAAAPDAEWPPANDGKKQAIDAIASPGGVRTPYTESENQAIAKSFVEVLTEKGGKGKSNSAVCKLVAAHLNASGKVPSRMVPFMFSAILVLITSC